MAAASGGSPSVPSLPPPRARSPPAYPDLYGKRRELAKVQLLEREIGFLEEELKFVDCLQPASGCCKEVAEFIVANSDPLIPTRSSCFNISWICCCQCCHLKWPRCSFCNACDCCACPSCSIPTCHCCSCSCPDFRSFSKSSCSRSWCHCQCPSCPDCSCRKCTCCYPRCPQVPQCTCSCSAKVCCCPCLCF